MSDYGAWLFVKHLAVRFALITLVFVQPLGSCSPLVRLCGVAMNQRIEIQGFHNVNSDHVTPSEW